MESLLQPIHGALSYCEIIIEIVYTCNLGILSMHMFPVSEESTLIDFIFHDITEFHRD